MPLSNLLPWRRSAQAKTARSRTPGARARRDAALDAAIEDGKITLEDLDRMHEEWLNDPEIQRQIKEATPYKRFDPDEA